MLNRRATCSFGIVGLLGLLLSPLVPASRSAETPASAPSSSIPPGEAQAKAVIDKSPRHGEYVDITQNSTDKPVRAYVVYPERKEKAPVVIVIHEIFGLSDWVKGVCDQLAADGFIAVAPDLLTGHGKNGGGTDSFASRDDVVKAVREIKTEEALGRLNATLAYGRTIPSASGKSAVIGFCWGGAKSFEYAVAQPELSAAVVYYGPNPSDANALAALGAPVLGLYGGNDARVVETIKPAKEALDKARKTYETHIYEGAGHGFLRAQDKPDNLKAAKEAWPRTIAFLREHTEAQKPK